MNAFSFFRNSIAALTLAIVAGPSAQAQSPYSSYTANYGYGVTSLPTGYNGASIAQGGCHRPTANSPVGWNDPRSRSAYDNYGQSGYGVYSQPNYGNYGQTGYGPGFQPSVPRPYSLMINPSLSAYAQWDQRSYATTPWNNSAFPNHHHYHNHPNGQLGYNGAYTGNYR